MRRYHQTFIAFLIALGLPFLGTAQSFKNRINDCYQYLVNNQNLMLDIDVTAWKRGQKNRPIDQTNFIYVNDKQGFYMKTLDIEVIQESKLTVRIDHQLKEVSVIPSPQKRQMDPDDMGFPTWLRSLDNLDSLYTIEVEKSKNGEVYTLTRGGTTEMIITIADNRIKKLVQYPPRQVSYRGKSVTTVVEMNYTYRKAQKRLALNDVLNPNLAQGIQLKNKYGQYKVIDYRDQEANEKK